MEKILSRSWRKLTGLASLMVTLACGSGSSSEKPSGSSPTGGSGGTHSSPGDEPWTGETPSDGELSGPGASPGDGDVTEDEGNGDTYVPDDSLLFYPARGLYHAPVTLDLSTNIQNGVIYYTFDGTIPTAENGTQYGGPITIDGTSTVRAVVAVGGAPTTSVQTHTYIFPGRVIRQGDERPEGDYVFWTTEMDPIIVDDPAYSGMIEGALSSIPTMSIGAPDVSLFGVAGIHRGNNLSTDDAEPHPDWVDEVEISLELLYPEGYVRPHRPGFQTNCGLKIQGGGGRWDNGTYDHKQSFGLRFRSAYDNPSLSYPVFEDAPHHGDTEAGKYDKLILRAGHNKSWGATWDNDRSVYTRDQLGRDLQLDMSGIGARGTFVHLYLNGLYWGLYNLTERPDDAHSSNYLGGAEDEYYCGKARGGDVDGDNSRFYEWRDRVASGSDFSELQSYLAVDVYADMCLLNVYATTGDFPQYYFGNRFGNEPGPIHFYAWDMEDAFGGESRRTGDPNVDRLEGCDEFHSMWDSYPDFRAAFHDRVTLHTAPSAALSDENVLARWTALNAYIEDAIVLESARWGDERIDDTGERYTRDDHWIKARDDVSTDLNGRAQKLIQELQSNTHAGEAYYP